MIETTRTGCTQRNRVIELARRAPATSADAAPRTEESSRKARRSPRRVPRPRLPRLRQAIRLRSLRQPQRLERLAGPGNLGRVRPLRRRLGRGTTFGARWKLARRGRLRRAGRARSGLRRRRLKVRPRRSTGPPGPEREDGGQARTSPGTYRGGGGHGEVCRTSFRSVERRLALRIGGRRLEVVRIFARWVDRSSAVPRLRVALQLNDGTTALGTREAPSRVWILERIGGL